MYIFLVFLKIFLKLSHDLLKIFRNVFKSTLQYCPYFLQKIIPKRGQGK